MIAAGYVAWHFGSALLLAALAGVTAIGAGLPVWCSVLRRPPTFGDLVTQVFLLGLPVLTVAAVALTYLGRLVGWAPPTVAALLIIGSGWAFRASLVHSLSGSARLLRDAVSVPVWCVLAVLFGLALVRASAPCLVFDAWTYHYGMVETFRTAHNLTPNGSSIYEVWPLNGVLLNAFWMGVGGEPMANAFTVVQTASFGVAVYRFVLRLGSRQAAEAACVAVLSMPLIAIEIAGGWNDVLLVELCLVIYAIALADGGLSTRTAVIAGVLAGYACGIKQNAPLLLFPGCVLGLPWLRYATNRRSAWVLLGVTVAAAAPWWVRAWAATGSPLFPALAGLAWRDIPRELHRPVTDSFLMVRLKSVWNQIRPEYRWNLGVPPWVLVIVPLAVTTWRFGRAIPGRYCWWAAGIGLGITLALSPTEPRYLYLFYVFAVIAACLDLWREKSSLFHRAARVLTLAVAVSTAGWISFQELTPMRSYVMRGTSASEVLAATSSFYRLTKRLKETAAPGDALLVFDGRRYRTGVPVFDADPDWASPRLAYWPTSNPQFIIDNCRSLGIRWVLFPYQSPKFRLSILQWARREAERKGVAPSEIVRDRFPEWRFTGQEPSGPISERRIRTVEKLSQLRPWLNPVEVDGSVAVYEWTAPQTAGNALSLFPR